MELKWNNEKGRATRSIQSSSPCKYWFARNLNEFFASTARALSAFLLLSGCKRPWNMWCIALEKIPVLPLLKYVVFLITSLHNYRWTNKTTHFPFSQPAIITKPIMIHFVSWSIAPIHILERSSQNYIYPHHYSCFYCLCILIHHIY